MKTDQLFDGAHVIVPRGPSAYPAGPVSSDVANPLQDCANHDIARMPAVGTARVYHRSHIVHQIDAARWGKLKSRSFSAKIAIGYTLNRRPIQRLNLAAQDA